MRGLCEDHYILVLQARFVEITGLHSQRLSAEVVKKKNDCQQVVASEASQWQWWHVLCHHSVRECLVEGVPPPMPAWVGTAGTGEVMPWYGRALTLREDGRPGEVKFLGCARAPCYKAKVGLFGGGTPVGPVTELYCGARQSRQVLQSGRVFPLAELFYGAWRAASRLACEPNLARLWIVYGYMYEYPGWGYPCIGIRQ